MVYALARYPLRTDFDLLAFLALSALRVEFDLAVELFKHRTYVDILEYAVEVQRRTFIEVDAEGDVGAHALHVEAGAEGNTASGASHVEIQVEPTPISRSVVAMASAFVRIQPRLGVSIDMPTSKWVTQHGNSLSTEDTGFFDTLQEAEAYAAELNLEETTPPQFVQFNEKWIVLSTPLADNAACFPTELPPELQRKYGYLGGG